LETPIAARNYLFVCGVARSGTTAFTQLMNLHPTIVVGIERYKFPLAKLDLNSAMLAELFTNERFFDWSASDTNVRMKNGQFEPVYDAARQRFSAATLVGDKIPGLYRRVDELMAAAPDARIVYMLRAPLDVAQSWNARAIKGNTWPAENDFHAAIPAWNESLTIALKHKEKHGTRFGIVSYDEVFGPLALRYLRVLQNWLGVARFDSPEIRRFLKMSRTRLMRAEQREFKPEWREFVAENADMDAFNRLKAQCIGS
jgi:hypothetical protein